MLDKGKGKGAVALIRTETSDDATGRPVAACEFLVYLMGGGGFGGGSPLPPAHRPAAALAPNAPPDRRPDAVIEEATSPDLAALYR